MDPGPRADGAKVLSFAGMYADGWCEPAASLEVCAPAPVTHLGFVLWLKGEAGQPESARFAVQVDAEQPLVFDVAYDLPVHVGVSCRRRAETNVLVTFLCDSRVRDSGQDRRALSFFLRHLSFS